MKTKAISFLATALISAGALAQEKPVKMSNSGICHAPNTTYYELTKNHTPFKTLDEYLKASGRIPKK